MSRTVEANDDRSFRALEGVEYLNTEQPESEEIPICSPRWIAKLRLATTPRATSAVSPIHIVVRSPLDAFHSRWPAEQTIAHLVSRYRVTLKSVHMAAIPQRVVSFLRERIDSVEQLEILLLLRKNPEKDWTADEVSRTLFTHPDSADVRLAQFASRGIFTKTTSTEGIRYQYRSGQAEMDKTISQLADAYSQSPVRIVSLIYSKPIDKIRTFSDAFKLRKEDE